MHTGGALADRLRGEEEVAGREARVGVTVSVGRHGDERRWGREEGVSERLGSNEKRNGLKFIESGPRPP